MNSVRSKRASVEKAKKALGYLAMIVCVAIFGKDTVLAVVGGLTSVIPS